MYIIVLDFWFHQLHVSPRNPFCILKFNVCYLKYLKILFTKLYYIIKKLYVVINFQLIPIMISICMMGFKSKNVMDYIKLIQLQNNDSHWFFKIIFVQVSIYVSLFFTMLVMFGLMIKDQVPKKLVSKIYFNYFYIVNNEVTNIKIVLIKYN